MRKNFYLIEAYILSYVSIFTFSRYFNAPTLYFNETLKKFVANFYEFMNGEIIILVVIITFLLLKEKYGEILNNSVSKRCIYIFIFMYLFLKNYTILT